MPCLWKGSLWGKKTQIRSVEFIKIHHILLGVDQRHDYGSSKHRGKHGRSKVFSVLSGIFY